MRTRGIMLTALLLLAGCVRTVHDVPVESYYSGCARVEEGVDTRAGDATEPEETLQLKYSSSGLVVIQRNAHYNCGINVSGMDISSSVEGDAVKVKAWVDPVMKCICPVRIVQAVVPDLETGKEYTLYFNEYAPIQFKFSKSLDIMVLPVELN